MVRRVAPTIQRKRTRHTAATDFRVNPGDPIAPMTAYCQQDHSLQIYAIINSNGGLSLYCQCRRHCQRLVTAQATGQDILIADHSSRPGLGADIGQSPAARLCWLQFHFQGGYLRLVPGTVQPVCSTQTITYKGYPDSTRLLDHGKPRLQPASP